MKICAKSVFGSVVLMQVFGALWYSKFAFFASWAAAQGKTPEQLVPTALPFVFSIISSIVASYAIAWTLRAKEVECPVGGAITGAMIALAITVPAIATHYAFLQINGWVIAVDCANELVKYALSGAYFGLLFSRAGSKIAAINATAGKARGIAT